MGGCPYPTNALTTAGSSVQSLQRVEVHTGLSLSYAHRRSRNSSQFIVRLCFLFRHKTVIILVYILSVYSKG